jgi:hypothetical protein
VELYSPKCVEQEFSEVHMRKTEYLRPDRPKSPPGHPYVVHTSHVSSGYVYELAESCIAPPEYRMAPTRYLGVWGRSGADLEGAHLRGAFEVTEEQLAQVKPLKGATMLDGQKYEY